MNVETLIITPAEAKRQLADLAALGTRATDVRYERLEEAYRAAAKGKPVLHLADAYQHIPQDFFGRPMIAVARADKTRVEIHRYSNRAIFTCARGRERAASLTVNVPLSFHQRHSYATAPVPIVPPSILRTVRGGLHNYHILFEVEQWDGMVDKDPYLLRDIGGGLYSVLAEWDVSPMERRVLGWALRQQ